jgi:glutaredoxin
MINVTGIDESGTCDYCRKDGKKAFRAQIDGKEVTLCTADFERQVRLAMKINGKEDQRRVAPQSE